MTNFRTIIVPEAVKSIYAEDPSVFAVVQQLEKVVCSQKISLKELADSIEARLLEKHAATEVGWPDIQGERFKFILLQFSLRRQLFREAWNEAARLSVCRDVHIFENVISVEPIKGDASQENSHCRSYL